MVLSKLENGQVQFSYLAALVLMKVESCVQSSKESGTTGQVFLVLRLYF